MTCMAQGALAQGPLAEYIDRYWDETEKKVQRLTKQHQVESIASWPENDNPMMRADNATGGWYYVPENTVVELDDDPLSVVGEVHLVISDGAELKCPKGLRVQAANNAVLYIFWRY